MDTALPQRSLLLELAPGSREWILSFQNDTHFTTGFFIHDHAHVLAAVGLTPQVSLRAGLLPRGSLQVLAVAFRIQQRFSRCFLNIFEPGALGALASLAIQDRLVVLLATDTGEPTHHLLIPNALRRFWRDSLLALSAGPLWYAPACAATRARLLEEYPTPETLWSALARPHTLRRHPRAA